MLSETLKKKKKKQNNKKKKKKKITNVNLTCLQYRRWKKDNIV